jgi:hypothetical protein
MIWGFGEFSAGNQFGGFMVSSIAARVYVRELPGTAGAGSGGVAGRLASVTGNAHDGDLSVPSCGAAQIERTEMEPRNKAQIIFRMGSPFDVGEL